MNKKVVIAGCTKNSATYIVERLHKLVEMGKLFTTYHIVLYENDSTDNTVEKLEQFKQTHPLFDYISENLQTRVKTQALAHGRNTLLRHIQGFEYMIMVDLDDVIATFKPGQIKYLFEHTEWDALFANCLGKYYDIWALRIEREKWTPLCPFQVIDYDCWEAAQKYRTRQVVSQHQISIPVSAPLIPVNSAFGGFGIYKVKKINGRYNGFDGIVRCEHVEFHKGMKRLFICPKFLVNKQSEHIA